MKVNLMCTYIGPLRFSSSFYFSQGGKRISHKAWLSEDILKAKGLYPPLGIKGDILHLRSNLCSSVPVQSIPFLHRTVPKMLSLQSFQKALEDKKNFKCKYVEKYDYIVCPVKYPMDSIRSPAGKNGIL